MADDKGGFAKVIVEQIASQVDVGTTIATAIIGGMVALLTQVALHNSQQADDTKKLVLGYRWLILAVFGSELVSIMCGYLARGNITDVAPILLQLPPDKWLDDKGALKVLAEVKFLHAGLLRVTMMMQVVFLFAGMLFVCCFAWVNRKHLQ